MWKPLKRAGGIRQVIKPWEKSTPTTFKESLFAFPYGFIIDLNVGMMVRPILKPWAFLKKGGSKETGANAWTNEDDRWFVLRVPLVCPFISFVLPNDSGFYLGAKLYTVNVDPTHKRYLWAKDSDRGNVYLCLSATIRESCRD